MASIQCSVLKTAASARVSSAPVRPVPSTRSRVVSVAAALQDAPVVSRRQILNGTVALSAAAFLSLSSANPANAFLGFEDSDAVKARYTTETADVLSKVTTVLALDRNDPAKDELIKAMRKDINTWVAKYRRENLVAGRPSYGNTYSALNAVAGHYNNFGTTAPIPKKRLDRLVKELNEASLFLSKGR